MVVCPLGIVFLYADSLTPVLDEVSHTFDFTTPFANNSKNLQYSDAVNRVIVRTLVHNKLAIVIQQFQFWEIWLIWLNSQTSGQLNNKDQLSLTTRVTCCITANVLQTNKVDAQCDKLATELSWQRFVLKVANFQLPHLHLTYTTRIWRLHCRWPIWVLLRFSASENLSPWATVWHCLHDNKFSHFSRTPTCDRRTDRHTTTANNRAD